MHLLLECDYRRTGAGLPKLLEQADADAELQVPGVNRICGWLWREPVASQQSGDGLDLGGGLEHLVAHLASPAGLLVPAERQCRVKHVVAVDPDAAGLDLL